MATRHSRIENKLAARAFHDDDVRALLDDMTIAELIVKLGSPQEFVTYVKSDWSAGDERPALANDDPAAMQAVGRCAASQLRARLPATLPLVIDSVHPAECGWCGYPLEELLKACAWAVHQSGYIETHTFAWSDDVGRTYARAGGDTGYRNKTHRAFWELPAKERERQVEVASGR